MRKEDVELERRPSSQELLVLELLGVEVEVQVRRAHTAALGVPQQPVGVAALAIDEEGAHGDEDDEPDRVGAAEEDAEPRVVLEACAVAIVVEEEEGRDVGQKQLEQRGALEDVAEREAVWQARAESRGRNARGKRKQSEGTYTIETRNWSLAPHEARGLRARFESREGLAHMVGTASRGRMQRGMRRPPTRPAP